MNIVYIGHATLLVETDGVRILTDPNFDSSLAGILKRVSKPGIALEELGRLDAVLLTHAHADHLSIDSLRALGQVPIIAPPAVARWLYRLGFKETMALAPGETNTLGTVRIQAAEATHEGSRYGVDRWMKSSNMYLLDTARHSCFFAGDTGLVEETSALANRHTKETGRRLDVALLPIGHAPRWKEASFRKGHLTSADALALFERLNARYLVPYHWGTFNHVTSSAHDAINRLREHIKSHSRGPDVRILEPGQALALDEKTTHDKENEVTAEAVL